MRQARCLIYETTDLLSADDEPPEKTPPNNIKNLLVEWQGIKESLRYELKKRVYQGELSLTQAGAQVKLTKQLHTVRTAFVSATSSPNRKYTQQMMHP